MKKITLLFALLSCLFGSAQIIQFTNLELKNILVNANTSNGRASTGTATFNTTLAREQSMNTPGSFPTNSIFQVEDYTVIDTNNDGEIQFSEAALITYLNLDNLDLEYTLNDLQHFTNLKYLGCRNCGNGSFFIPGNVNLEMLNLSQGLITTFNITQHTNLTHLILDQIDCQTNTLPSLPNLVFLNINISGSYNINFSLLPSLQELYSKDSGIGSTVNFSQNIALTHLYVEFANISNLNISQNNALTELNCSFNQLSTLDASNKPLLTYVNSEHNYSLNQLNVSNCGALTYLNCTETSLETLDVSDCQNLNYLNLDYIFSLNDLNIKNGNSMPMDFLGISTIPDLAYICVDEDEISYIQSQLAPNQNPNINSYCNFTPGGTFYEVSGTTLLGNEINCENSEVVYPFLKFDISNGDDFVVFFSDASGNHDFAVPAGTNILTPILENTDYFTIFPESITVEFPATESPLEQNFCVTLNGIHPDLEVTIIPLDVAVPGFDTAYKILYKNKGNQAQNATLTFTYEDDVLDYLSSSVVPNTQSSGLLSWDLGTLNVFESGFITLNFNLNTPMETPPLNSGDLLSLTASIDGTLDDETPADNYFSLQQEVFNSFDPNDKTCLEGQSIHPDLIGEFIHYRIRFENTGTFPAQNVVIKDMIDASKFDIATMQMVDASHDCRTRISGQKVEFIFENIQLDFNDATNDGYVVFKIKTLPSLTLNSTISNTAEIYFDFNFPIITNTETSTFEIILSNENFTFENELVLHPNPAKNTLSLTSVNGILIQDVEIYNLQGQKVMEIRNASENLDVSRLQAGTYLIKVFTNEGSSNAKFVKE